MSASPPPQQLTTMPPEQTIGLPRPELSPTKQALREARLRGLGGAPASTIPRRAGGGDAPLSFAQERLWFLDRVQPGLAAYNFPAAWRISGEVDEAALERALGELVRRHEVLRTVFREVDGVPSQVVAPFTGLTLPVENFPGRDAAERDALARWRAAEEAACPMDLAAGPLFRARLLRLDADDRVLLVLMHHIVTDGWSTGVLIAELFALYAAFAEGCQPSPPAPSIQYGDYAAWQRAQLGGGVLERHLAYWRERLAGAPALLELPTDRPRPAVQGERGARERMELAGELPRRLEALARAEGATLFMVLLGAFQLLLGRYAGSDDVVVGSPAAGRSHRELEGLIGLFVNQLALRTDLSGDPPFREVLRRVREVTLGAYEHQDAPFDRVVAELRPERTMAHAPLFQAELILQTAVAPAAVSAGPGVRALAVDAGTARLDLSLDAVVHAGGIRFTLEYRTDLFDAATIRRMLEHLSSVLEQVTADPEVRLSALELLDPAERRRVLEEWNRTETPYRADACIHQRFAEQAERAPDAVALVFDDESITYRELDARANRLAHRLVREGAGPEARVGICMERSAGMVAAMLAVLKAGAAYLPLDPSYPAERLAYMLEDAGASLLLTHSSLRGMLPAGPRVVVVDEDVVGDADTPADAPWTAVSAGNAAYVIYTSGSTGRPKGVVVTHGNVASFFAGMDARVGGAIPGTWLAVTRIGFDIHVLELWWTLSRGFRVVVHPDVAEAGEGALAAQIRRHGVTHLQCTPSLASVLVAESGAEALAGLDRVLLGGEPLPEDLASRINAVLPGGLLNMYGPTETTVWSTTHAAVAGERIPIGRPIANARVYVLDAALRPQPAGVPGELFIGGPGVTRGYLGRPALTAERYLPDPFSAVPGARLYRTGDRARWRHDGVLDCLGRVDAQVKIRGFRIEPGEVEAALRRHPGVTGCAAVAREDTPGVRRLVAYVTGGADAEALRAHLRSSLPDHMVPAAFVALDHLPLTPNGKVDRRALPAPEPAQSDAPYAAPERPEEQALAAIWAEVLGVERVGVHDNFFALGGDSLLFVRVVSRARKAGLEITPRQLFEHGTVAGLASVARQAEPAAAAEDAVAREPAPRPRFREDGGYAASDFPLAELTQDELDRLLAGRRGVEDLYPLSPMQEGLLYHSLSGAEQQAFQIQTAQRLETAVDVELLQRVWSEVVHRHPFLRTAFDWEGLRRPLQRVQAAVRLPWVVEDWRGRSEREQAEALERYLADDRARGFVLTEAPLLRFGLFRTADDGYWFVWNLHHLVLDGWSWALIRREVFDLYRACSTGEPLELGTARPYRDYIAWLGRQDRGAAERYWRRSLAGFRAPTPLGVDRPAGAEEARWASQVVKLPAEQARRLEDGARRKQVTLNTLLQGAWGLLLSRYAGEDDVVFGNVEPGRPAVLEGVDGMVGLFINTVPLRLRARDGARLGDWLRALQLDRAEAREYEHAPLAEVQGWSEVPRGTRLFESMFVFENYPAAFTGSGRGGLQLGRRRVIFWTDYPLTLIVSTTWVFELIVNYDAARFGDGVIERMTAHLVRLLEQLAEHDHVRLGELEVMDDAERRMLLETWSASAPSWPAAAGAGRTIGAASMRTDAGAPGARCIHHLFQEQAARTPHAPAVTHRTGSLTYRELDRRADGLARDLRRRGVGPDARVGICLERTPEMVVAVLAVLRAGGAYVPLDPAYPAERLAFMLADAGTAVVLTQESLRALLPVSAGVELLSVDGPRAETDAEDGEAVDGGANARSLAYVIYTSGSTGRPKGVAVEHGGLSAYLAWACRTYPARSTALHTSLSFDLTVTSLFVALLGGGCVDLVEEDAGIDGLAGRLRAGGGYGMLKLTPAHLRLLGEQLDADLGAGAECLAVGGEALLGEHLDLWKRRLPDTLVVNEYGPTEAVVGCCIHAARAADLAAGRVPIGRPVPGTRLYVLDAAGRPVPAGVPGELYVGGAQVARGYVGRPALTAARFVPDPFGGGPGARLYRTGDQVRWLPDGRLDFMGRLDAQVKVRGFRVEPGEIEAVLRRHPDVADCAVVAREHAPGDVRLAAYVTGAPDPDALRTHLRRTLPEHMVPSDFVLLEALPLTGHGKLDRRALPAPPPAVAGGQRPETELEARLAALWQEVLGVEVVGVEDSFFDLGGHSLLLMRLQASLARELGRDVPLVELFRHRTVRSLAGWLQGRSAPGGAAQAGETRGSIRQAVRGRLAPRRPRGV